MKKIFIKILILIMPVLFIKAPALAIDINQYEDFSSRSLIINQNKETLTQEEKNILISKKLQPNIQCLIKQIKKDESPIRML